MVKKFPLHPKHPERICWGCKRYCADHDLQCGNGCVRIQHPCETNGNDWYLSGDWQGLLSDEQWVQIALEERAQQVEKKFASPGVKLRVRLK